MHTDDAASVCGQVWPVSPQSSSRWYRHIFATVAASAVVVFLVCSIPDGRVVINTKVGLVSLEEKKEKTNGMPHPL